MVTVHIANIDECIMVALLFICRTSRPDHVDSGLGTGHSYDWPKWNPHERASLIQPGAPWSLLLLQTSAHTHTPPSLFSGQLGRMFYMYTYWSKFNVRWRTLELRSKIYSNLK